MKKIFFGLLISVSIFTNYLGFDSLQDGKKLDAIPFFGIGLGSLMMVFSYFYLKSKGGKK